MGIPILSFLSLCLVILIGISIQRNVQSSIFQFQMQTKEFPSFFQISINSDKFTQFTFILNSVLSAHEKMLQEHTSQLSLVRSSIEDKLSRIRKEMDYEREKSQKKRKEDHQYFNTFLNDWTLKHERFGNQWKERIQNWEQGNIAMKKRVNIIEEKQREDTQLYKDQKNQMLSIVDQYQKKLENDFTNVDTKVFEIQEKMKSSIATNDCLLRNILDAYQSRNIVERQKEKEELSSTVVIQRKNTKEMTKMSNNGLFIEELTIKQGRQKKKKRVQQKCQQQNLQYASVSAKLDKMETRLNEKQNPVLNKIIWSGQKPEANACEQSQNNISSSTNKIELQRKHFELSIINLKLEHIEQIIEQKIAHLQKDVSRIATLQDLLTDKIEIATRKVEKDRTRFADISAQIKRFEEKKIDEKMIETVMTMIKRHSKNMEEEVDKKVGLQIFDQEKQKLNERLHIVSETLSDKADKEEIKRAFQFLQDKIRQIVMIIAEDAQQEKEGAIRRIPFKCLSCDKDLEFSHSHNRRFDRIEGERKAIPRGSTSSMTQMRKRIRILNNDDK